MGALLDRSQTIIIVALIILCAFIWHSTQTPSQASSRTSTSSQSSSAYPGCSFDGDYTNDKPGACPEGSKR
jgi:hypothetical protein